MKKRAPARVRVSTGDRRRSGGQTRSGSICLTPLLQKAATSRTLQPAGGLRLVATFLRFLKAPYRTAVSTKSGTARVDKSSLAPAHGEGATGDNDCGRTRTYSGFREGDSLQLKPISILRWPDVSRRPTRGTFVSWEDRWFCLG